MKDQRVVAVGVAVYPKVRREERRVARLEVRAKQRELAIKPVARGEFGQGQLANAADRVGNSELVLRRW
ncbi:MAG: hypothetical protein KC910_20955 [Candidatus Eremiobacteraeota bacterium]|nr:hypothetical protein [Candidatus Eremiobacteraeota bacterium]